MSLLNEYWHGSILGICILTLTYIFIRYFLTILRCLSSLNRSKIICNWENQYPSDNWPWSSVGQNSMRKWSRWRYKKTNKIFDEKRNHKVPPSRQHVVQLTWSQSWLLESLAAWPMFTRCVDYMVLVTYYLYRLYIFPDFQKKTSKLFRTRSW